LLNLYTEKYSFNFFLNDVLAGIKIFLLLFPIAFSLAFFCGASPLQGLTSCAVAAAISAVLGGSKYQITTISLPLCLITFEILHKYQYKGLLFTAVFVAIILFLFGITRMSEIFKHISYAFVAALSCYVLISIILHQIQYILEVDTIQSVQGISENFGFLRDNLKNISSKGVLTGVGFLLPLLVLKMFMRGFLPFFVYILVGCGLALATDLGYIPSFFNIKTVGKEFMSGQAIDNIFTIARSFPSKTILANVLNYAFVIAIVIGAEACFCTNISSSITGDKRVQSNMELISSGLSNFAAIACGGLFVAPDINFSLKHISMKTKTIISMLMLAALSFAFVWFSREILRYIPLMCISGIMIVYACTELMRRNFGQYFDYKTNDCYIFFITLIVAVYFGFIPAVIVGFVISSMFFAQRMVRINDASVHTTKKHDAGTIEFMSNKNGFSTSQNVPANILKRIEVIQIYDILSLNIANVIEGALSARGKYPKALIVYFQNVPFMDGEAFTSLRQLVNGAKKKGGMVIVTGTNGMLLDIIQQRANKEYTGDSYGYIIPDFTEAVRKTAIRLGGRG
jgi:SulP family sulfate permease